MDYEIGHYRSFNMHLTHHHSAAFPKIMPQFLVERTMGSHGEPDKETVMNITTITPKQLFDIVQSGAPVELIDVRTPIEFREVHVEFARNVPLDQLDAAKVQIGRNGSPQTLYVICRSGSRGKQACEKLTAAGCLNVVNVEGGTLAWDQAGLPVVRGQKAISLERQVRIAAGSLVLIGTALGTFVHPAWLGLAAFVGAGLVFAGLTDTCGMGLLLARMPWNQVSQKSSTGTAGSGAACCSKSSTTSPTTSSTSCCP